MSAHPFLSASGSSKWLNCPPSARLESHFPDKGSEYAAEGTLAHEVAEIRLRYLNLGILQDEYEKRLRAVEADPRYSVSMNDYISDYVDTVWERYSCLQAQNNGRAYLFIEQKLDFSSWVPEGFGTGDAIIIANVVWLMEQLHWRPKMFNMLILDESSSFKNHQGKRFKALRKVRPYFEKVLELTGTPGDKLMDLWAQIYLLDGGKRLGRTITEYRNRWFVPDKSNGYVVYSYKPKPGAEQEIYAAISDITFSMSADDWLELPERIDNVISIDMGTGARARYKELERLLVLELPEGDVTAATAATLSNKLLQMANGAVYDENKGVIDIHDEKLAALKEITESGNPILVFYAYRHDRDRLLKWFNYARELKTPEDVNDWNTGKIKMLITHPASAGYGLNLQAGGSMIVWFGLTWSLEQYKQANARLYRQGQ